MLKNGELCIEDNVFEGYFDLEVKNKVFCTGDLGVIKDDILFIIGRKKEIIIKGGINISPIFVEEKIKKIDFVDDVAIFGVEDDILGEKVICAVVLNKNNKKEALISYCQDSFSDDKQIDDYLF